MQTKHPKPCCIWHSFITLGCCRIPAEYIPATDEPLQEIVLLRRLDLGKIYGLTQEEKAVVDAFFTCVILARICILL